MLRPSAPLKESEYENHVRQYHLPLRAMTEVPAMNTTAPAKEG